MTESKFSENRCFISSWLSLRITKNNRPVTDVLVMNARTFQKLLDEAISIMDLMAFLIRQPGTLGEECPVPCHNYFLSVLFFTGVDFSLVSLFRGLTWDYGSTCPGNFSLGWIRRVYLPDGSPRNQDNTLVFLTHSIIFYYSPFRWLLSATVLSVHLLSRCVRKRAKLLEPKGLGLRVTSALYPVSKDTPLTNLCHNFPTSKMGIIVSIPPNLQKLKVWFIMFHPKTSSASWRACCSLFRNVRARVSLDSSPPSPQYPPALSPNPIIFLVEKREDASISVPIPDAAEDSPLVPTPSLLSSNTHWPRWTCLTQSHTCCSSMASDGSIWCIISVGYILPHTK